MEIHKCEGIVLQSIKYGDYDQILTLFTRDEGLLKMIVKGANSRKQRNAIVSGVLTQAEFIYVRRQSSLVLCREQNILNPHLKLRNTLPCLEGACCMAKAVLTSQMEQKPVPQLYDLLVCYYNRLPFASQPATLTASFSLKVLRHEGLFGLTPHCSICHVSLIEHFISQGESYCQVHQPPQAIHLTPFQAEALFIMAYSRSLEMIEKCHLECTLQAKIDWLFKELISG